MPFRTIDTDIWSNDFFDGLKAPQKLIYIYLFSNPLINNVGVFKTQRARIAYETGTPVKTVNAFLGMLEDEGQIVTDGNFILVTKFIAKQTHFGNDTEVNKNDRLLKNLRQLWKGCPSAKLRRALACAYPTLFEEEQAPSVSESSPLSAQDKPLAQEEEAPSSCEVSPLSTEGKPLAQQMEGSNRDIGDNRDIGERIDPPLPPKGEPDAIAPADTESGSEEAYADVSVPEQPTPSPEATQSESLEAVQPVLSPEQPPKPKRKRTDYRRDDMQTVWNRLPIQEDEETFKKTWEKGCREGWIPDLETIMAALDWQIPMWAQREPQYVPGPVAYLRKRKWNDKPRAPAHPQFQRKRFDPDSYTREDFANLPENPDGSVDLKKLGVF